MKSVSSFSSIDFPGSSSVFAYHCLISLVGFPCTDATHCLGNTSHGYNIHLPHLKKFVLQQKPPITITSLCIVLCVRECSMATQMAHLKSNNLLTCEIQCIQVFMYQHQIHSLPSTILTINQNTGQPFQLLKNSLWNHVAMEVMQGYMGPSWNWRCEIPGPN